MPRTAQLFLVSIITAGAAVLGVALFHETALPGPEYLVYFALALIASGLKVRLPGITGTYSFSFLFALFGLTHFSLLETLAAGLAGAAVQSLWRAQKRPTFLQIAFNMANLALSIGVSYVVLTSVTVSLVAGLTLASALYFFVNTILVSGVLSLLQGQPLATVARQWYVWSFPYYLIGAALVGLLPAAHSTVPASAWLLLLPLLYLVHFFYGLNSQSGTQSSSTAQPANNGLPFKARLYAQGVIAFGLSLLAYSLMHAAAGNTARFCGYLALALVAATFKVRLPGMTSTISVSFVLLLVASLELPQAEALMIGALVGVMQCVWKPKQRPALLQVLFNAGCLTVSAGLAHAVCSLSAQQSSGAMLVLPLVVATALLYASNTLLVTTVLCLVQGKALSTIWQKCHFWSFPFYLVGSAAAGLMITTARTTGWEASLLVMPLMGLVFVSYRLQVARTDNAALPVTATA